MRGNRKTEQRAFSSRAEGERRKLRAARRCLDGVSVAGIDAQNVSIGSDRETDRTIRVRPLLSQVVPTQRWSSAPRRREFPGSGSRSYPPRRGCRFDRGPLRSGRSQVLLGRSSRQILSRLPSHRGRWGHWNPQIGHGSVRTDRGDHQTLESDERPCRR